MCSGVSVLHRQRAGSGTDSCRVLICGSCYTPLGRFRKHLSGYVASRYPSRNVLECFQHCHADRITHRWRIAQEEARWRDEFLRPAALVRNLSSGWFRVSVGTLGSHEEDVEQGVEDLGWFIEKDRINNFLATLVLNSPSRCNLMLGEPFAQW